MRYFTANLRVIRAELLPGLSLCDWGVRYELEGGLSASHHMMTRAEAELALTRKFDECVEVRRALESAA